MAAHQTYKFVPTRFTGKDASIELSSAQYVDYIKNHAAQPVLYEAIFGNCVPYADFDNDYADQKTQEANLEADFKRAEDAATVVYPRGRMIWRSSCGFNSVKQNWKNSFHLIVRGAGYYACGLDIPKIPGADESVYKAAGQRQLLRVLGASKEEDYKRVFQRRSEGELYPALVWWKLCAGGICDEKPEDSLVQHIAGEKLVTPAPVEVKRADNIVTVDAELDPLGDVKLGVSTHKVSIEMATQVIMMLSPVRVTAFEKWIQTVWAIKNTATEYGLDLRAVLHEVCKKTTANNYNQTGVNDAYDSAREMGDSKALTFGSIRAWAKEDSPEAYSELTARIEIESRGEIKPGFYEDIRDIFANHDLTLEAVENYMLSCFYKIYNGSREFYMIRSRSATAYVQQTSPFEHTSYHIMVKKMVKGKEVVKKLLYSKILADLSAKAVFKRNYYDKVDFLPMHGTPEHVGHSIFNTFTGFGVTPLECKDDDADLALVYHHIKVVLANNNPELNKYICDWLACCLQQPARKIGTMLVFTGPPGAGKNTLFDWIGEHIYGDLFLPIAKISQLTQQFNVFMAGKLFCLLNEIQSYSGDHAGAEVLKGIVTDKSRLIEPKGRESYRLSTFENYVLLSNNPHPLRIEVGDRRYMQTEVSDVYCTNQPYFDRLHAALTPESARKFMYSLMQRDLVGWNPKDMPSTAARVDSKVQALPSPMKFMYAIARGVEHADTYDVKEPVRVGKATIFAQFLNWVERTHGVRAVDDKTFFKALSQADIEFKTRESKKAGQTTQGYCGFINVDIIRAGMTKYVPGLQYD